MHTSLRNWLAAIPLEDAVQQRQAQTLQAMLLVILSACVFGLPLGLLSATPGSNILGTLAAYLVIAPCILLALVLLRRGRFTASALLGAAGVEAGLAVALLASGLTPSDMTLLAFSVPIAQAGLMLGRRGLWFTGVSSLAIVTGVGLLDLAMPELVGWAPLGTPPLLNIVLTFALVSGTLMLLIDRFGSSFRDALAQALDREQELQQARNALETIVAERTASLRDALHSVEEREASLRIALDELRASAATIRDLSSPVLPVLPGVLVAPLVGALDVVRAENLASGVLQAIEQARARNVILDITGVPVVDTHVAQTLLQVAQAARLLGARPLLVGIRPEVAQTMVALGVDVGTLATYSNLQEALLALLPNVGNR
jgi:anti-anti-sigma factor